MKREEGKEIKAWEITEELWEKAEPLIPQRKRIKGKTYQRKPAGGRKLVSPRKVPEGIFYAANRDSMEGITEGIRRGWQYPSVFQRMGGRGFFKLLREERLLGYDEATGLGGIGGAWMAVW